MGFTRSRTAAASFVLLTLAGFLFLTACGKKAPPFLPVPLEAKNLNVQAVTVGESGVVVIFRVPSEIYDIAGEEERWSRAVLLRRDAGAGDEVYVEVASREEEEGFPFGDRVTVSDDSIARGGEYDYRLELRKRESEEWAAAKPFPVAVLAAPPLPEPPRVRIREGALALSWEKPSAMPPGGGYILYRREAGDTQWLPVTPEPILSVSYVDTRVEKDRAYCYRMRTVIAGEISVAEGPLSAETCSTAEDRTPPPPPPEVIAVVEERGIRLSWLPSPVSDVSGYNVYRSGPKGAFKKMNSQPLPQTRYFDEAVERDQQYGYRVTAVDNSRQANESTFSNTVRVTFARR